jgi:hypothetical protein
VTERQGRSVNLTIRLTATDTAVYQLVADIFAGCRDIRDDTFAPHGATGTWTSITLNYADGRADTVKNIDVGGEMGQLYRFVDTRFTSS